MQLSEGLSTVRNEEREGPGRKNEFASQAYHYEFGEGGARPAYNLGTFYHNGIGHSPMTIRAFRRSRKNQWKRLG